jgi:hypothetical protein
MMSRRDTLREKAYKHVSAARGWPCAGQVEKYTGEFGEWRGVSCAVRLDDKMGAGAFTAGFVWAGERLSSGGGEPEGGRVAFKVWNSIQPCLTAKSRPA